MATLQEKMLNRKMEQLRRQTTPPQLKPCAMDGLCNCLPAILVLGGILATLVLFASWASSSRDAYLSCAYLLGLLFVGPLLFSLAAIIHRLDNP
jgi:hypothetical protein